MSWLLSGSPGRLDRVKSGGERHGLCPGLLCAGSVSCLCRTYSVRRRACPSPARPQPRGPVAGGRGTWGGIGIRRVSAPMPYGGREAVTPRSRYEYRRQCHGHRPAEGGSPTNRTREHAGGMFEGKAPNQSADWRERRSKGPDGHRSVRTGGREHAERGPGQHRRLCRPQRSCVSAPYPVSPFLARSAA